MYQLRDGHRATEPDQRHWCLVRFGDVSSECECGLVLRAVSSFQTTAYVCDEIIWAIRTAQLRLLPDFHLRPIDVVVFHGPWGDLV